MAIDNLISNRAILTNLLFPNLAVGIMRESAFRKRQKPKTITQALPGLRRIVKEFWPEISQQKLLLGISFIELIVEVVAQLLRP